MTWYLWAYTANKKSISDKGLARAKCNIELQLGWLCIVFNLDGHPYDINLSEGFEGNESNNDQLNNPRTLQATAHNYSKLTIIYL
jgi:hypothetical protein